MMNTSRRGAIDLRLLIVALGLLLAAVLFVGSTFAAAPTGSPGSRVAQAGQGQSHSPNAPEALVVVSPSNMDGWVTTNGVCTGTDPATGSVSFVPGPGTPPLGVGSFQFTTGTNGNSFPNIRNANYHGIRLDQINAFSYSTYVQAPMTNTGQAPYIILNIDNNGDTSFDAQLFFEPTYQTGTYGGATVPNQCPGIPNCVALGTWQHWDAKLGGWHVGGSGPPLVTLQSYAAANPNARIINTSTGLGGVRFVAGCGHPNPWGNFVGNIDNVSIGYGIAPTATNTPLPSATNTTAPSSTNTAIPSATDTAAPTSTSTETAVPPTVTNTATPTETSLPPTATDTATPTETPFIPGPNSPEGGPPPSNFTTYDFEPDGATATTTSTSTATRTSTTTSTATQTSTTVPSSTSTAVPSNTRTSTSTAVATGTSTTIPSATSTACPVQFADVQPGDTFYTFIRCLACRGIVSGYPCGGPGEPCNQDKEPYYRPGANVTRGQLTKIIANSAGLNDDIAEGQQQFADVEPGDPFYIFVERLAQTGAIAGYPCGESGPGEACDELNRPYFRPNSPATRGQISKIVSIAAGFEEDIPEGQQTFTDVPTDSPFWVFIERLAAREIISGYGDEDRCPETGAPCFRYNDLTTRGQMAKIAANTFFPNCQTPARP